MKTMSVDRFLAEYYGTLDPTMTEKTASAAEVEQQAEVELFHKLAAEGGIDLAQLSDEQVNGLWANFQENLQAEKTAAAQPQAPEPEQTDPVVQSFVKAASDAGIDLSQLPDEQVEALWGSFTKAAAEGEKDEKKEPPKSEPSDEEKEQAEKKAAAEQEFAEKQAAAVAQAELQEKLAEADYLGRVMAHSYVQELKKIAAETETTKEADGYSRGQAAAKGWKTHSEDIARRAGSGLGEHTGGVAHAAEHLKGKGKALAAGGAALAGAAALAHHFGKKKSVGEKLTQFASKHKKELAAGGAAAAAGTAAAVAAHEHGKKKKASALDELAAEKAVEKLASDNWDLDEGVNLLTQVIENGPSDEGTKIAFAQNTDQAIEIRAFELLEQAGYPVKWG